ncbi:hypothetical protein B4064_1743 [Caldibacillus thermoamylovorans]|nr:hypothetical protein B4065_2824 [Caldibacillus thermoamylovorans]KIO68492.1 hypothetical protein B4064_1743 [Caldibacillus thermoamylovorans]
MASADFLQFNLPLLTSLFLWDVTSPLSGTLVRPPRVRTTTFLPCNCCIYCMELVQYRTLFCLANSSIPIQPFIQFLFVSSGFCLRLPSDSTSRWTPLPLANSSYCQACSGLSPPSYSPCRAHHKEGLSKKSYFRFKIWQKSRCSGRFPRAIRKPPQARSSRFAGSCLAHYSRRSLPAHLLFTFVLLNIYFSDSPYKLIHLYYLRHLHL